MFQQLLPKRIIPYLPKYYRLDLIKYMSNDSKKNGNNQEVPSTDQFEKDSFQLSYETQEVIHLLEEAATFEDVDNKDWMTTPYPKDTKINVKKETVPKINPKDTSVILFPGQGIIKVGMIKKYLGYKNATELFDVAKEIINFDLLNLCLNGPQEKLNRTQFNQLATVVSSLAALEVIREEKPKVFESCIATAGYSIGEITALIFSGAINFEDGIRLAWTRGQAMQYASDIVPQGMLSVSYASKAQVQKACADAENWAMNIGVQTPVCKIAIYLTTERKIIAGNIEALKYIEEHKEQYGFINLSRLPVSGAFHTPLMNPALKSVSKMLNSIEIHEPRCRVYSNQKAAPYSNVRLIKKLIMKQIVSPVKWEQCLHKIYSRPPEIEFPQTYDIGSNGKMKTILKLVNVRAAQSCTVI
ncbi:PREDICTED: probable malonyl-CoA-acyl carrier protein transacylase, mitochondrial [Eufriesea mexicana]|uniref:probable malonyl-CoA-acyl carrier protein transacylase, mitochondrial n=1 Tax=Eufriesea mexicana TaxID=516756 RepID=UPI00083BBD3D|nr:PREDICTED: probable malonyl-CoA-acyl carrier protein transacylase, mitochondrial [Eufriesea mexicana]